MTDQVPETVEPITVIEMNHFLPYLYQGKSFEEAAAANPDVDPVQARERWDVVAAWMAENPLPPGFSYDVVPE